MQISLKYYYQAVAKTVLLLGSPMIVKTCNGKNLSHNLYIYLQLTEGRIFAG